MQTRTPSKDLCELQPGFPGPVEQPLPVCERVEGLGSTALAIGAGAAFAFAYLEFQYFGLCSVFSSET